MTLMPPPKNHTHTHGSGGREYVQRIYLSKLGSEAERGFYVLSFTCLLRFSPLTGKFGLGVRNEAGQRLIEFGKRTHRS